ncbi:hypothetical protein B9Z55_007902 [Caenorhabditis nigoni]|uniref:BTB domain-containing protein n=1 Tax=Caenorhabditis nigoni TaxID=1611254 RepID=A0A2G5VBW0_9PELO|nr:hypothetical protein B9Z55_007902 [Caenorhabditis nigoni]
MSSDKNPVVKLNVGGVQFQTLKSTLTKFDGMFKVIMETEIPVKKDENSCVFIDRSPKHFEKILNFMRDGDVALPESPEDVKEIQTEAQYYLLTGLVELCKKNQKPVELQYPDKFRYIKSDEELFNLTYKPKKPVIVFFGPIHPSGIIYYPWDLDLLEFHKKYASKIEIYIRLFAHSDELNWWHYNVYANERLFPGKLKYSVTGGNTKAVEDLVERVIQQNR